MALASFGGDWYCDEFRDIVRVGAGGRYTVAPTRLEERFGPARRRGEPLQPRHYDVAHGLQIVLEEAALEIARWLREASGAGDLCLAGGVALNCVMNARLRDHGSFARVWVQSAAGDAGAALGAALWAGSSCRSPTGPRTMSATRRASPRPNSSPPTASTGATPSPPPAASTSVSRRPGARTAISSSRCWNAARGSRMPPTRSSSTPYVRRAGASVWRNSVRVCQRAALQKAPRALSSPRPGGAPVALLCRRHRAPRGRCRSRATTPRIRTPGRAPLAHRDGALLRAATARDFPCPPSRRRDGGDVRAHPPAGHLLAAPRRARVPCVVHLK